MRRRARGFRVQKPLVLIGSVIHHEIQNDLDPALPPFAHQPVEIPKRAVCWIDLLVIGHATAKAHRGGGKAGGDPNRTPPDSFRLSRSPGIAFQSPTPVVVLAAKPPGL